MLIHSQDTETVRESAEFDGNTSALGRLIARRPPVASSEKLVRVGEAEDGADVESDEVEISGGE